MPLYVPSRAFSAWLIRELSRELLGVDQAAFDVSTNEEPNATA